MDRRDDLRSRLAQGRAALLAAIDRLTLEDWDRATSNPSWTAREILVHLSQAEPGLLARMHRFLDGTSELRPGFDLNVWNTRQVAKNRNTDIAILVQSLSDSRPETLRFLDTLTEDQLDVRGWHASGREMSVMEMFDLMASHEEAHAQDILTARM